MTLRVLLPSIGVALLLSACAGENEPVTSTAIDHRSADGFHSLADSQAALRLLDRSHTAPAFVVAGACVLRWGNPNTTGCAPGALVVTVEPVTPRLRHSGRPPVFTNPIVISFSQNVYGVSVESSKGDNGNAMFCNGSFGQLSGFDSAGTLVASQAMALTDPSDCGADSVTWGSRGSTPGAVGVRRVQIDPAQPITFPVFDQMGILTANYTVSFTLTPTSPVSLRCEGPTGSTRVTRAMPLTCTATLEGSGAITGWRFDSPEIDNPKIRSENVASLTWSGPLLLSGRVTVSATVGGRPDSAFADVMVEPRQWVGVKHATHTAPVDRSPLNLDDTPADQEDLGRARFIVGVAGTQAIGTAAPDDGPNGGLIYFADNPFTTVADVAWNSLALVVGSPFHLAQRLPPAPCDRARVVEIVPLVKSHEGFAPVSNDSHVAWYRATVDTAGSRIAEGLILGASGMTAELAADSTHRIALAVSRSFDSSGLNALRFNRPGEPNCDFIY